MSPKGTTEKRRARLFFFVIFRTNIFQFSICFLNKSVYFCDMKDKIEILKGLHPGVYLQRELNKHRLKSGHFAESIGEHPQTISAIIRGRRAMNIPLSLRIENALGLEEGLLMTLQVHYDIIKEKHRLSQNKRPDISKIRPALFWDTTLEKVDFTAHKRYVINRVFERGTEEEIQEIIRFYGRETILSSIANAIDSPFADNVKQNLKMYLNYEE